jgi:hypothetical protein
VRSTGGIPPIVVVFFFPAVRGAERSSGVTNCTLEPYLMGCGLYGERCGRSGLG